MPLPLLRRCFCLTPLILAATFGLNGCAGDKPSSPENERRGALELIAHGTVNQGAPLKITLMQLTRQDLFLSAGYQDLQHDALNTLPDSLLTRESVYMLPGDGMRFLSLRLAPGARYLGLFAEYKDTGRQRWRIALPLSPPPAPSLLSAVWSSPPPELALAVKVTPDGLEECPYEQ